MMPISIVVKTAGQVMDRTIDAGSETNPSLCIPRATGQWSQKEVRTAFARLFESDCVERVVVNPRIDKNSTVYSQIFVHFTGWPDNERLNALRRLVMNGGCIKLVYAYPFYWKCYKCRPRDAGKAAVRGWCGGTVG